MDANKQLLVVSDPKGKMIARKLLALTDELGLIGYHLYSSLQDDYFPAEASPQSLHEQVETYCRKLASRIGATLVDDGLPKPLHGSLWYNDGPIAWTQ